MLTGPRRQLQLLGRAPSFRLLFSATFASNVGTWVAVIALTVDVYDRTDSAKWVSALLIADFLPAIAVGLLLGPLVDRLSRRRLLIATDLVRFGVFALLPFASSPGQIVALAAVTGFATGFFRPAVVASLPNLVPDADLAAANSLLRSIEYVAWTLGTLLGGAIAATAGPDPAYWLNAGTFLISALLILGIAAAQLQSGRAVSHGHWQDLKEGFDLVFNSRALLAVFISWNLVMLANAGVNVAEVVLAKISFDSGSFGFGLLYAGSGIGLVVGSLYAATWLEHRSLSFVYGGSLALMAFGALAAGLSPSVWVAFFCMALMGSGNGCAIVCNSLIVQRGAPDHLRGRAFTMIMSVNFAVLGIGMVIWGPITDAVGARWVFVGASVLAAAGAVVGRSMTRGITSPASISDEAEAQPAVVS